MEATTTTNTTATTNTATDGYSDGAVEQRTKTTETPTEFGATKTADTTETKEPKKYTFKRNGVEEQVDEETYTKYAQKAWAADKTLAEAKKMQRELEAREAQIRQYAESVEQQRKLKPSQRVQQMLEELQDNPEALTDFRGSIEQWLLQKIDEESASPEVQRAMRAERELERLQRQKEHEEKQKQQIEWQRAVEAQRPQQEKLIIDTLKTGKLPVTEWNIKSVADAIYNARVRGLNPTPEQVAQVVKEDRIEHIRAFSSEAAKAVIEAQQKKDLDSVIKSGEWLVELFGDDVVKALRFFDTAMYEKRKPNMPRQVVETAKNEPQEKKTYQYPSYDAYLEDRRKRALQSQV